MRQAKLESIGIVGAGQMGKMIAVEFSRHGFPVILVSHERKLSVAQLNDEISKVVNNHYHQFKNEINQFLEVSHRLEDLNSSFLIIEALREDIVYKRKVILEISKFVNPETIFASNTSSLSIAKLFDGIIDLTKVFGLHFFNPVNKLPLVELCSLESSQESKVNELIKLIRSINKQVILVKDSPGYVVNRLLIPFIHNAILLLEDGISSVEQIDLAMKLGANHPMGPLQVADLIGLDVVLKIYREINPFTPVSGILENKIHMDKLGRKTGEGFYKYHDNQHR